MSDYIKREDAIEAITDCIRARLYWRTNSNDERQGLNVAMCAIEDVPTADVAERKRGKWITTRTIIHDGNPYCSLCDYEPYYARDVQSLNYCPNCGADMRGDSNE